MAFRMLPLPQPVFISSCSSRMGHEEKPGMKYTHLTNGYKPLRFCLLVRAWHLKRRPVAEWNVAESGHALKVF